MAVPRMSWPLERFQSAQSDDANYETGRYYVDEKKDPDAETSSIASEAVSNSASEVIGSTDIFDEYGNIKLIPVSLMMIPNTWHRMGLHNTIVIASYLFSYRTIY